MTTAEFKQARRNLGLNQSQLAALLGYGTYSRISELEGGRTKITDQCDRLMQAYIEGYRPRDWPLA